MSPESCAAWAVRRCVSGSSGRSFWASCAAFLARATSPAPTATSATPATPPVNQEATFVANVAAPEFRIFKPQRANGHGVLVIPGGGYQFVSVGNEGADFASNLTEHGYTVFVLVYRLPGEGWQQGEDVLPDEPGPVEPHVLDRRVVGVREQ